MVRGLAAAVTVITPIVLLGMFMLISGASLKVILLAVGIVVGVIGIAALWTLCLMITLEGW